MPDCLTLKGCAIRDEAPDRELNRKVNAFCEIEMLELSGGNYANVIEKTIKDSGLDEENVATILEAKAIVRDYRESKQQESATIAKARSGGGMR